jgi:hypothetical protein
MPRKESAVQAAILAYLGSRSDIMFWRNNTGAVRIADRFVQFGTKGAPDILCVQAPTGRCVGVEVKREGGGSVSAAQRRWGEQLTSAGGLYVVARSVEEVRTALGPDLVKLPRQGRVYPGATPG